MKHLMPVLAASLLFSMAAARGQNPAPPADRDTRNTRARMDAKKGDADVTYGRIKELVPGQKVEIDVDNAPDKTFDLTSKDVMVKMQKGLKVGDPVKVVEHSEMGKTKSVTIAKHTGGGVTHGDKDPAKKKL
ncbi:MAG TPA: hypothetical protein VE621_18355 [Bryobacteraceae bacterium]|nr:hypothetical protein [Bryobacteraceae bacterium]